MVGQQHDSEIPPSDGSGHVPSEWPATSWPKVLGIVMIIFGVLGTIVNVSGLFVRRLMEFSLKRAGANTEILESPLIQRWMAVMLVFAGMFLVLGILQAVSGVGVMRRRAWGASLAMIWAGLKVVVEVASLLADWVTRGQIAEAVEMGVMKAEDVKHLVGSGGTSIAAMLPGLAVVIALAVFVLIWLSMPSVKEETGRWG